MILHLSPGSGSLELHIHDDAQVALYQPGDRPARAGADPTVSSRPVPRWFTLGLTGAVCLALGYGVASHGSATPSQVAGTPTLVRPIPPLPSNIPLARDAAPLRPYEASPPVAIAPARPSAEAEPAHGVPAALARQMTQPPVVVPPAASARPSAAAGSSAFGLEN